MMDPQNTVNILAKFYDWAYKADCHTLQALYSIGNEPTYYASKLVHLQRNPIGWFGSLGPTNKYRLARMLEQE